MKSHLLCILLSFLLYPSSLTFLANFAKASEALGDTCTGLRTMPEIRYCASQRLEESVERLDGVIDDRELAGNWQESILLLCSYGFDTTAGLQANRINDCATEMTIKLVEKIESHKYRHFK